jgi:hypothetical protein
MLRQPPLLLRLWQRRLCRRLPCQQPLNQRRSPRSMVAWLQMSWPAL